VRGWSSLHNDEPLNLLSSLIFIWALKRRRMGEVGM